MLTFLLTPRFITMINLSDNSFTAINFEGNKIVNAGGIVLLPAVVISVYNCPDTISSSLILFVFLGGMVVLGLADDLHGEKRCKGFRGHLRCFWQERKISTGLIKALPTTSMSDSLFKYSVTNSLNSLLSSATSTFNIFLPP